MGGRSRAAAQILSGKGFKEVYNLKGGIKAWEGLKATGPLEMGMEMLTGTEDVSELIIIAYGMEKGLKQFYQEIVKGFDQEKLAGVLDNLAKTEQMHMDKLFELYADLDKSLTDRKHFENRVKTDLIEGGFKLDELLKNRKEFLNTENDIISIAMMIEAQGLDLYMRYSQELENDQGKKVFYHLAQEEKGHLETLGRLMDQIF